MDKHTPGPWQIELGPNDRLKIKAGLVTIALVPCANLPSAQVDARLIAAAPLLLELAEKVAEHFEYTDAPLCKLAERAICAATQED